MLDALAALLTAVVIVVGVWAYYVVSAWLCVSAFDAMGFYKGLAWCCHLFLWG